MATFPLKLPMDSFKKEQRITITPDGHVIHGNFTISLTPLKGVPRDPKASKNPAAG
jgi:hypothetical protein